MTVQNFNKVVSLDGFRNQPSRVASLSAAGASGALASPPWEKQVKYQLGNLLMLESGWDGFDAKPIETETVKYAVGLLQYIWPSGPTPHISPTCYGGLQLEWHIADMDLEIEVVRQHQIHVLLSDSSDESEISFECKHDLSELFVALKKFQIRSESGLNATAAA